MRLFKTASGIALVLISTASATSWAATRITSIDFRGTTDPNQIEIQADGPLSFDKQENAPDRQVILEIRDAKLAKGASRKIDTSSFNSPVSLISPYQVTGQPDTVRVVIQMRQDAATEVRAENNRIVMSIPAAGAASAAPAPANTTSTEPLPAPAGLPAAATADGKEPTLDQFAEAQKTRKFSGRPITLQLRDVDAADVFRLIGEASGFNIVLGDDVKGKVTLSLVDTPWDQALDVVLHTLKLGAERNGNILRITTLANLTNEKTEEYKAQQAALANSPRITRIFSISYANLNDLEKILTKFATQGMVNDPNAAALVQVDNRTNSLIVRDTAENLEKMKKLIEQLDTQTPQVMVEAKVVEATEGFSKTISGSLGFSHLPTANGSWGQGVLSFSGANPIDPLVGTPGVFSAGSAAGDAAKLGGTLGLSPNMGFLATNLRLNAVLNMGESENTVKVISSPKTVVLNKEQAKIVQGTPILVPGTTTQAGITVPANTIQQANLSLDVKPTVTNDGSVLMLLSISRDIPLAVSDSQSAPATRKIDTTVLVESGSTLVIGGIYTMTTGRTSSGFPFLRKLPILGALFGKELENNDRSEIMIFITPRILNSKDAGLTL